MGRLPWTLADFPQGYILLLHKSPRRAHPSSNLRRDFYLYGSTDVPSFASPLEFVKHAEWLTRGAHRTLDAHRAPRCACKYCDCDSTNRKQSVISGELRRVRARILARIQGDENEDEDEDEIHSSADGEVEPEPEPEPEPGIVPPPADLDADADADAIDVEATIAVSATTDRGDDAKDIEN